MFKVTYHANHREFVGWFDTHAEATAFAITVDGIVDRPNGWVDPGEGDERGTRNLYDM
jgi:hypothetical protein